MEGSNRRVNDMKVHLLSQSGETEWFELELSVKASSSFQLRRNHLSSTSIQVTWINLADMIADHESSQTAISISLRIRGVVLSRIMAEVVLVNSFDVLFYKMWCILEIINCLQA